MFVADDEFPDAIVPINVVPSDATSSITIQ